MFLDSRTVFGERAGMKTLGYSALLFILLCGCQKSPEPEPFQVQCHAGQCPDDPMQCIVSVMDQLVAIIKENDPAGYKMIQEMEDPDDMIQFHHGWGMGLRNGLGLWGDSKVAQAFRKLGVSHADYMSGILMNAFWQRVHDQPLGIEEAVALNQAWKEEDVELRDEPCPTCGKIIDRRLLSCPLSNVTDPGREPEFKRGEVYKLIHFYACPDGHWFAWTSAQKLHELTQAELDFLRQFREKHEVDWPPTPNP